jgi:hypothetical protein
MAKFEKGHTPPRKAGRPPGSVSKVNQEFRATVQQLLDKNTDNVALWLEKVANGDPENDVKADPAKALDLLIKIADFAAPKLARMEHVGDGGGPVRIVASSVDLAL